MKTELRSLDIAELRALLTQLGLPAFRGEQVFRWLHKNGVASFDEMGNISQHDRQVLEQNCSAALPDLIRRQDAAAGDTVKLLLEFADGERVETVVMLYRRKNSRDRATCCVSTQSGCVMGCRFCATGLSGAGRNLTAGEICAQISLADKIARQMNFDGVSNVVYMGMGEPLLNLANVQKSINLLNEEKGLNIGARKITVSSCGLPDGIRKLADWGRQINLAISLHAADDELRRKLMPGAARYPIKEVIAAADYYKQQTGRRVCYEYAMFRGVNDRKEAARSLARLLKGRGALVNLIPANPLEQTGFYPSQVETIKEFAEILQVFSIDTEIREERGRDIDAACGQLRRRQG